MINNQRHQLAAEIDEGYEIKKQMAELEKKSDAIKKKLREAAANEPGAVSASGESVVLYGNKHKAKVNLSEDSFSFPEETSTTDIRRVKAILGKEVATIEEGVKLKEGITLRKVKEVLEDKYGELFEDSIKAKFDAQKLTAWLGARKKVAVEGQVDETSSFIERNLSRKPNTNRVTFSK